MAHLISIELDFDIAKRLLRDLHENDLPIGMLDNLSDLRCAIEEALDSNDD